jgi:hypothetical protein
MTHAFARLGDDARVAQHLEMLRHGGARHG